MKRGFTRRTGGWQLMCLAWALAACLSWAGTARAQLPASVAAPPAQHLARDAAVRFALQNNPFLNTVRQQYGFGKAAVVLGSMWTFNMFNVVFLVSGGEPDGSTDGAIFHAQPKVPEALERAPRNVRATRVLHRVMVGKGNVFEKIGRNRC